MHGKVTDHEWQIFKEAYRFFEAHCDPPANQDDHASDWWATASKDIAALDYAWKEYPLMRELLTAILSYIEYKAKEKTKEMDDFHV